MSEQLMFLSKNRYQVEKTAKYNYQADQEDFNKWIFGLVNTERDKQISLHIERNYYIEDESHPHYEYKSFSLKLALSLYSTRLANYENLKWKGESFFSSNMAELHEKCTDLTFEPILDTPMLQNDVNLDSNNISSFFIPIYVFNLVVHSGILEKVQHVQVVSNHPDVYGILEDFIEDSNDYVIM